MKKLALGLASAATLALGVAIAQPRPDAGAGTPPPAGRPGMGPGARAMPPGGCGCMQQMMGQGQGGPGRGPMMQPGSCPGAQAIGSVRAEHTKDGAVLRFTARTPADAAQVQAHVEMMARCINAHHAGQGGAVDGGTPAR